MKVCTNSIVDIIVGWRSIISVARLSFSKGLMFFVILFISSFYIEAQTLPGTYTTSWVGNSFAPASNDYNFVQYEANSLFVEADGTLYTNGYFDEAGKEMGVYKDGIPIGKVPNSHGYSDGGAITTNDTYLWASVEEGRVRRYNKSDYSPAAADFLVSNTSSVSSQNIVGGLAVVGTELFASDYTGNKIKVYSALNDGTLLRSWTVTKPITMATDASGNIWVICYDLSKWGATRSIANIYCYSTTGTLLKTLTMPSDVEAKYIAIDKLRNELLVTDIGDNMQIHIYNNINTTPTFVESFGTQGGILSGTKGLVAPLKFNVPNLVGVDGNSNIIVWANGNNTDIPTADGSDAMGACVESYTRAGVRNWQMLGLEFVDMATFDPATDGADLYTKHEHFTMDYSKPDGQQWTWKGWTLDRKKYPGDARLFNSSSSHLAPTLMKRINGKLFMYMTSMTSDGWWVYRFDNTNEGEIAIPCGNVTPWENLWVDTNGNGSVDVGENSSPLNIPQGEEVFGRNVDDNGTIWFARITGGIYNYPVQSINSFGVPVYSPTSAQVVAMPAPFTDLRRINYDVETDVMYLTGYTATLPMANGDWGGAGRLLARYNNWSAGNRTAAYTIILPTNISPTSFIVEKEYIFLVGYASKGKVTVYNASTGALTGEMIPGANVGGIDRTGSCDLRNSVAAFKKSTGEYLVTVEDDLFEKVLIYRWCTPGSCDTGGGAVQSVSISPDTYSIRHGASNQLLASFTPSNADNRSVTWSTSNASVATVNSSGLVSGVAPGTATITVITVDGGKTATADVTITPVFSVQHADVAMYIDGNIEESEWNLNNLIAKPTSGVQNNEGHFDVLWDENYLYVGIIVKDANVMSSPDNAPWDNDAVEVYLDGNHNKGPAYDNFDIQLVQSVGSTTIWSSRPTTGIIQAIALIDGGYSMEMAIPWSLVNTTVFAGAGLGFDIAYDDNDDGSRNGTTTWYGDGNNFFNTSNFDDLILVAGTPSTIAVTGVVLDSTSVSIMVGDTKKITASVSPINATNKAVVWSTSNASIATVNQAGLISAIAPGETSVKVTTTDGNFQAMCAVTSTATITSNDVEVISNVSAYPNPVSNGKIFLSGINGLVVVKLTDVQGRILYANSLTISGVLEIDDLNLKPGLYFLSIQNDKTVFKIIVK